MMNYGSRRIIWAGVALGLAAVAPLRADAPAAGGRTEEKTAAPAGHGGAHWEYEGDHGASHWGDEYATCGTGKTQSPVDLAGQAAKGLPAITIDYHPVPGEILNNGHTIQVNMKPGSRIAIGGKNYELVQFHFHTPSEHKIAGKSFPLELHFVHKSADQELAVVGVLFDGKGENPALGKLWTGMPAQKGDPVSLAEAIDPSVFLPPVRSMYRYTGSLTTPPCSEGVKWHVMREPVPASAGQVEAFRKLFPMNARPVQPINGRTVVAD